MQISTCRYCTYRQHTDCMVRPIRLSHVPLSIQSWLAWDYKGYVDITVSSNVLGNQITPVIKLPLYKGHLAVLSSHYNYIIGFWQHILVQ